MFNKVCFDWAKSYKRTSNMGDNNNATQYNWVSNSAEKVRAQIKIIELRTPMFVPVGYG